MDEKIFETPKSTKRDPKGGQDQSQNPESTEVLNLVAIPAAVIDENGGVLCCNDLFAANIASPNNVHVHVHGPGYSGAGHYPIDHHETRVLPLNSRPQGTGSTTFLWLVFENQLKKQIARFASSHGLTSTETVVLEYLSHGMSVRSIALEAERTYGTIRWHVQNILAKTQCGSQCRLIAALFRQDYAF